MTRVLDVPFALAPSDSVSVGHLAMDRNTVVFEYAPAFASAPLTVNPRFDSERTGLVRPPRDGAFKALHGVFAGGLPDAWGRMLLDRRLRQQGTAVGSLTELDRLAYGGGSGRGALTYARVQDDTAASDAFDLDAIARDARSVIEGDEDSALLELQRLAGSSGGARPKVHVALDDRGDARPDSFADVGRIHRLDRHVP